MLLWEKRMVKDITVITIILAFSGVFGYGIVFDNITVTIANALLGGMSVSGSDDVLVQWRRPDMEGVIGDACVIEKALAEFVEESHDIGLADEEEEDDTYIDDGYVAPVDSSRDSNDDDFFV